MTEEAMANQGPQVSARKGLVIVNTGNGKGKTTAALGLLFRAWGWGMRVRMFQFIKHTGAQYGEHRAAQRAGIPIHTLGDGFTSRSSDMGRTRALALRQWQDCRAAILSGADDLIVLDEFTYVLRYGWVPIGEVIEVLRQRRPDLHVVITGREAPAELIEFADLVTDMKEVKHPHDSGVRAQPGIEF